MRLSAALSVLAHVAIAAGLWYVARDWRPIAQPEARGEVAWSDAALQEPEFAAFDAIPIETADPDPIEVSDLADSSSAAAADFDAWPPPAARCATPEPPSLDPAGLFRAISRSPSAPPTAPAPLPAEIPTPQAANVPPAPAPAQVRAPRPIVGSGNRPPDYPRAAMRRGWEGTVVLCARVSAEGTVESIEIVQSSGHAVLDEAAAGAVRGWLFEPANDSGGRVAPGVVEIPVVFRLE